MSSALCTSWESGEQSLLKIQKMHVLRETVLLVGRIVSVYGLEWLFSFSLPCRSQPPSIQHYPQDAGAGGRLWRATRRDPEGAHVCGLCETSDDGTTRRTETTVS